MHSATLLRIPTREEQENAADDIACYSSQNIKNEIVTYHTKLMKWDLNNNNAMVYHSLLPSSNPYYSSILLSPFTWWKSYHNILKFSLLLALK